MISCFTLLILLSLVYSALGADSVFRKPKDVCDKDKCDDPAEINNQNVDNSEINVIITFTNAKANHALQEKFGLTVSSMLKHSSVPLAIYIIGEPESQKIASKIMKEKSKNRKSSYRVRHRH